MLLTAARYLCICDGRKKVEETCFIVEGVSWEHELTDEMILNRLHEMGIKAIKILHSNPKARVLGMSFSDISKEK